jgi:hypothetical protein
MTTFEHRLKLAEDFREKVRSAVAVEIAGKPKDAQALRAIFDSVDQVGLVKMHMLATLDQHSGMITRPFKAVLSALGRGSQSTRSFTAKSLLGTIEQNAVMLHYCTDEAAILDVLLMGKPMLPGSSMRTVKKLHSPMSMRCCAIGRGSD